MPSTHNFDKLLAFIERLPAVDLPGGQASIGRGSAEDGTCDVEFLSWIIESTTPSFTPDDCEEWLGDRLPRPVHDAAQPQIEDGGEDEGDEN